MSPSPEAQRKVMQAVRNYPSDLDDALVALPTDAASLDEVAEMLDKLPDKEGYERAWTCGPMPTQALSMPWSTAT